MLSVSNYKQKKISNLINLFKQLVNKELNLRLISSFAPIQCIILSGNERVKSVCNKVQQDGFDVRAILAPTVAEGQERIRICLHAFNTEDEVKRLVRKPNKTYK